MIDNRSRIVYSVIVHKTCTIGGDNLELDVMAMAEKLIALRGKRTQEEVANALDISKSADFFNVDMNFLLGKDGSENDHYYLNDETREIAQEVFENPDMRTLFKVARDIPPERLKAHIEFMKSLKEQENKHNDEGC